MKQRAILDRGEYKEAINIIDYHVTDGCNGKNLMAIILTDKGKLELVWASQLTLVNERPSSGYGE